MQKSSIPQIKKIKTHTSVCLYECVL